VTSRDAERPLRADAALNRSKVLDAAKQVFAIRGLDVSLEEIAAAAGVGVTTVTRRFADRDALVETLFEEELAANVEAAKIALTAADAGDGLAGFLRSLFRRAATDRGIAQVILSARYGYGGVAARRQELTRMIFELVERAREHGQLRDGVSAGDIPIMMLMIGSVADFSAETNTDLIESVVPSGHHNIWSGTALSRTQLTRAMAKWRHRPL
jgi:AcrR family transcriptional regulator